ncbi:MAG: manganese efflux pump MntP family protein [Desulfobacteraceae bacterium]|nr:manganese efflux pump MntP family protein [Desulfobacteraceae bacterium]
MSLAAILLIALALAVDAFAVALAAGVGLPRVGVRRTFRLAWHFGFFQAAMNVIGWAAGLTIRPFMAAFDHWLAFFLLAAVGGRMIWEALREGEAERHPDPTRGRTLVILSIATSIDSLAVGISFSLLAASIWRPALIIGLVAALLTGIGLHLGRAVRTATPLGRRAEVLGGLVLVGIGLQILHEHGVF